METTRMKIFIKVLIAVGVLTGLAMYIGGFSAGPVVHHHGLPGPLPFVRKMKEALP